MLCESRRLPALVTLTLAITMAMPAALCAQSSSAENPPAKDAKAPRPPNPFEDDAIDPFVGVFEGDKVVLTIDATPKGYGGTVKLKGSLLPIVADKNGDNLAGQFRFKDFDYEFVAEFDGDSVLFKTGRARYRLTRQGKLPATGAVAKPTTPKPTAATPPVDLNAILGVPSPKPGQSDDPTAPTAPTVALKRKDLRVGTHPAGFKFRYPDAWRLLYSRDAVMLQPKDTQRDLNGQPLEGLLLNHVDAEGSTTPGDPAMLAVIDRVIGRTLPFLKRAAEVTAVDTLIGPGAVITYEGAHADGTLGRAIVFAALREGKIVYMYLVGRVDLVTKRRDWAGHVFASFGWTEGQVSPAIVGTWSRTDEAGGDLTWRFDEDGRCQLTSGKAGAAKVGRVGRWVVINDKLFLAWSDGSAVVFHFHTPPNGVSLAVRTAGSQPIDWKRR